MLSKSDLSRARARSLFLSLLMILSTTAALATTASASVSRTYTTNRDPADVAIGDFDCDGHNDLAIATEGTHTLSILWNDGNGDFSERQDVWVSGNQSRNADWDEFANVEQVEVGEFTGDSAPDIVIYQKNNPFKTNDQGQPAGEPGNITIIENGGCGQKDWSIGERFTHFWVWDMAVGNADQTGDDDIYVLDITDVTPGNQRVVTYSGPITSSTQGLATSLGTSSQNTWRSIQVGDWGESQSSITGSCTDDDIFLLRSEGLDYSTGTVTNPGNDDNVSIIEYDCTASGVTPGYPVSYNYGTNQVNTNVVNLQTVTSEDFSIADIGGNGYIDTIALIDSGLENVTYSQTSSQGNFGTPQLAYFGPYISWTIAVHDLNGDGEPDFVNPTIAYQQNTTDSAGGSTSNFWLNFPTTVQVTLSDGNGGHVSPLSYVTGRRPSAVDIGQLSGGPLSADDLVIGHTQYNFGGWRDNFGWEGQYDTLTIVEMDNKDLAVTGLDISPVDRFFGAVGEGSRTINVTVTNTGMDTLNGQTADLDVVLKIVDETNSTNTTVYSNDWDSSEVKTGCGAGCNWAFEEYIDDATNWHLETNHSVGASTGNNDPNVSANYLNPTNFMWAGNMKTNQSGGEWSGYGKNWDDSMVLEDVDLTGADRAFMSIELFQHLGLGALGNQDASGGFIVGDVWDDLAIIEIGSEETGWTLIGCPQQAALQGACSSGMSMWGGFDNDRMFKQNAWGAAPENIVYYGLYSPGTYYGWNNFTEEGLGSFDLSGWAGETVDVRFRLRTGFQGSTADDNESRWSGRDGFAVDNISIWKQNTTFLPNPQSQSTTIGPLNNLEPGQEYTTSIQANLLNDTTYRISATISNNAWDEQDINDDAIGFVTPYNLFDPAVEGIVGFNPGGLYAEGFFDIGVTTNNWGNTAVDFEIEATVYSATPSDVFCGPTGNQAVCKENFDGGSAGYLHEESQNPKGVIYNENTCSTKIFNSPAYWFGHPCETATSGYDDAWANETLTIPNIDLTNMGGDFVSLNFEYYADTFYTTDQNGDIDPSDYALMTVDYEKGGANYSGLVFAQWNDYNEDGTCQNDDDGNGIVNATESIDSTELAFIGDAANEEGSGNYNVFFNSEDLIKTASIDLTHLYVQNRSSVDSTQWTSECISLQGSTVDVNFEFQSDEDGRNGINDGFKGVGFNNITLQEYTFVQDAKYNTTRSGVDAEDVDTSVIASHEFTTGVYRVDVKTIFDNTTVGTNWYNNNELSTANNIDRVIFNVESVDISIGRPKRLTCLADQTLPCVLPIDSALTHSWDFQATNGVLAGDYIFFMKVVDMADGSTAHLVDSGAAVTLESQEKTDVSFTPWNGWLDGHEYNISFYGELADGSETGNKNRFFHAKFANDVDIAILSDTSTETTKIKEDLAILGMNYTQYEIGDWDKYFDAGWFTHYDKIILPMQDFNSAKDTGVGGDGYYQSLADPVQRKTVLTNFMSAGGTIQAHFAPHGEQIYGKDSTSRLPFNMKIQDKSEESKRITYDKMNLADPYHPLMENVNRLAFQGFDANSVVSTGVIQTTSATATELPAACGTPGGYMEDGGEFQSIIRSTENNGDTLLGVCSYSQGGLIVTTIDVASHSERANSTTFPLLGNLLKYQVTPYPVGFDNEDITINGEVPTDDPNTNGYKVRYMKSNTTLTFDFESDTTATLDADWVIEGPNSWDDSTLASGVTGHTSENTPMKKFCKQDFASQTGCAQGEEWHITLFLHDDAGHTRQLEVTVQTNDAEADEFNPVAYAEVDMRDTYDDLITMGEPQTYQGVDYDEYRIVLDDEDGELVVHFDASNSTDADALTGNGIETYEWTVLYDAKYGDDDYRLLGDTYTQTASSGGLWSYKFKNVTVDETGSIENQIKIELKVIDSAGRPSDEYRMYFVILEEGMGDEPVVITWDQDSMNRSQVDTDTITLSGTIVSGSEDGDVYIEAAFESSNFSLPTL
ncbi:MAG TPA: VCBS repeat-containing protein, partial [Poseidonia sp.]|nr:VCBS repeat-containing protein [Poseidonia sp.]